MRPHHTQTRNMTMRNTIRRLLLHFRKHIAHDFGVVVVHLPSTVFGGSRSHDGHEAELRPCQGVVEVVFEKVVFGQVGDVACLYGGEEVHVRGKGGEGEDVDHCAVCSLWRRCVSIDL